MFVVVIFSSSFSSFSPYFLLLSISLFSVHLFNILQLLKVMNSSTYARVLLTLLDKSDSNTRTEKQSNEKECKRERDRVWVCVKEILTNHLKSWHTNFNSVRMFLLIGFVRSHAISMPHIWAIGSSTLKTAERVWIKRPNFFLFATIALTSVHIVQKLSMLKKFWLKNITPWAAFCLCVAVIIFKIINNML